jgi:hypothetical protein
MRPSDPHDIELLNDPGTEELCAAEEEILQGVYQSFGQMNPFDVVQYA